MVRIREATRFDNDGLLSLTSLTPMSGEISIRSDRYPDFFRLLDRRGQSLVLVAEEDGKIVGCVSAARVPARVEGKSEFVHYLGDLKAHPDYQKTGLAVRLLRGMHRRLLAAGADLVVCTAAYGNRSILPFFEGRAGFPKAAAVGIFRVYQILPSRRRRKTTRYTVQEESALQDLFRLYDECYRPYQFGPVFQMGSLPDAQHWSARSGGDIMAAISLVDVGDSRQHVLIRLPVFLQASVSFLRSVHRIIPVTDMPEKNKEIRVLYIKALACREGHEKALDLLIQKARNVASERHYHFLTIGIHEKDPLGKRLAKYPKFTFKSMGFVLSLKRNNGELQCLLRRIPYEDYSLA